MLRNGCSRGARSVSGSPSAIEKARRRVAGDDPADVGDRHARLAAAASVNAARLRGRDRAQDLVVLAAGQDRLDQRGVRAERLTRAADSGTRATSMSAETFETRQSLARSAARPSDTSIAAVACVRTASASALRGCGRR